MSRLQLARQKLRGRYLGRLPLSIDALRAAVGQSPPDRYVIATLAHKLQGSGGTYGFDEISEAASNVQRASTDEYVAVVQALIEVCEEACLQDADDVTDDQPAIGGPEVLIVDDDPAISELLSAFVKTLGYTPRTVGSVLDARAHLSTEPSMALVILDMMLSDGTGLEVLENIPATTPTIVLTTDEDDTYRNQALEGGVCAYLHKPFEPEAFERQLRHVVDPAVQRQAKHHAQRG